MTIKKKPPFRGIVYHRVAPGKIMVWFTPLTDSLPGR